MANKEIVVKLAIPERYFTKCYHDFIDCNLLNGEEKMLFLSLKRFIDVKSDNGNAFPTIETLQKITGWGNQKVVKYIKSLVKKGVVKKIRQGLKQPNIYILSDSAEIWKSGSKEELKAAVDDIEEKRMIELLTAKGYCIRKGKGLDTVPTKAQYQAPPIQNLSHISLSTDKDNTSEEESQAGKERYCLEDIKALYEYDSLITQYPEKQTDIDIVFDILYDALNSTKPTIRISGEDKPAMVVIGKLMKLQPDDLIYSIEKYHEQDSRIKNVKGYLLTVLYNSREQNHLDIMNLGHHNGDF